MGAPTLGSHKVEPTNNPLIDGVLAGTAWNAGTGQGTSTITYSLPTSSAPYGTAQGSGAGEYPQPYPFAGFSALTSTQIAEVQRALALVSSYTGLTFTQVTEVPPTATDPGTRGDIRVGNTSPTSQPTAIGFFQARSYTPETFSLAAPAEIPSRGISIRKPRCTRSATRSG